MNTLETNTLELNASDKLDEANEIRVYTPNIAEVTLNEHKFGIRAANIDEHRNSASMLINKMYAWRGYTTSTPTKHDPNKITLTASDKEGKIIGTLSIGIDSEVGLLADQVFKDCIDPYRKKGNVCEIIKLAIEPEVKSKEILASLFHVAFLYARDLHKCDEIFIEVNPRHRKFYEIMLSFSVECPLRSNPRVDAPAVLLRVNTEFVTQEIIRAKNPTENTRKDRSFYPYFFSKDEEAGILKRLTDIN